VNLPVEVIDAVRAGRCLVFVGSRFSSESRIDGGLAVMTGQELAKSMGWKKPKPRPGRAPVPVTPSVRDAGAMWERENGRAALVEHLQASVGADEMEPTSSHRFIMGHFDMVFTTVWDDLFEKAAAQVGRTFVVVSPGEHVPEATPDNPVLVRLRGGFSDVPVVTRADEDKCSWDDDGRRRVREILRSHVVLFVGYRPDEEEFEALFEQLTDAYGASLPRCHLAVAQGKIDDYQWQRWVWRGLLLFTADPEDCAEALEAALESC